jgi:hypothetical protein
MQDDISEQLAPGNLSQMRLLKMIKPLRIFKLLRLLKAGKMTILLEVIDRTLNLPVFVTRMLGIFGSICFVVHSCVCLFWLVKEASFDEVLSAVIIQY